MAINEWGDIVFGRLSEYGEFVNTNLSEYGDLAIGNEGDGSSTLSVFSIEPTTVVSDSTIYLTSVMLDGIPSTASFGEISVVMTITPSSVAPSSVVNSVTFSTGGFTLGVSSIESSVSIGEITELIGPSTVVVTSIDSGSSLGSITMVAADVPLIMAPVPTRTSIGKAYVLLEGQQPAVAVKPLANNCFNRGIKNFFH